MHSVTLAVAAYTLLASSFTALFYLLKENIKNCVNSPLHIFSISDALSSIFAAIIFLVNQLYTNPTIHQEDNNINHLKNITKLNRDFVQFLKNTEEIFDKTANCEFKYVLMQYGMFFIPFTNAFISLLGYSLHYITNIIRLDRSCAELTKPIKQIMKNESTMKNTGSTEGLSSPGLSSRRKRNPDLENIISSDKIKNTALSILKETTFNQPSKYDKITVLSVIIEWLVPILITAILHLGGYQRLNEERNLKNDECIFATNFPFDNCYYLPNQNESKSFSSAILFNSTPYPMDGFNYIEAEDSDLVQNTNSAEVNNVVSNVYKLVQTVLDRNETKHLNHFNTSDLWNITRFMEENSTSPENESGNEWKLFENLEKASNEANLESEIIFEPETNLKSENTYPNVDDKIDKNKTDHPSDIVSIEIKKTISKNDIYADLIKKIQTGIQKVKVKEKNRFNRQIQSKENQNQFTKVNTQNEEKCSRNQCFISTRFLKIHLFILLFIVYFMPIFASTILNVCATYKYKQIKEKVETNCVTLKILTNFGKEKLEMKNKKDPDNEDVVNVKKVGWLAIDEEFQDMEENKRTSSIEIEIMKEEEMFANILEHLGKAKQLSKIFQINLLLAILLWTPLFLEVLSKAFLCINVPNWLMDTSFLGAVSFGILRNFLNINMIKTFRIVDRPKKDNSVHPTS